MYFDSSNQASDEEIINDMIDNINNLNDLIQTKTNHNLLTQYDFSETNDDNDTSDDSAENSVDYNPEDCLALIEIPLQPVSDALDPTVQNARNYLIQEYQYTNQEIDALISLENGQEEDLILLVMAMINAENISTDSAFNYMSLFGTTAHAQS
jgi:hypothetical protein